MHCPDHSPRTSSGYQPNPATSLGGLFVLIVIALALLSPTFALASEADRSLALPSADDVARVACPDGLATALDSADPLAGLKVKVVTLGSVRGEASQVLDPSVFLVRVSANGREITPVCPGSRSFIIPTPLAGATTAAVR